MEKHFIGKPASVLLDHLNLRENELAFLDEPPRNLRAVVFRRGQEKGGRNSVIIWLRQDEKLFSITGAWNIETVRAAIIEKITVNGPE
jgi:hypothetical protein